LHFSVSFRGLLAWRKGVPRGIVAWCGWRVKRGRKCLIAWRFSRPVRPVRLVGLVRHELMELVEWKEL